MRAAKVNTEIRQDQIARAALALIARDGFQWLNMAGLAREVGVVPSGIYRHYRNKDEVLERGAGADFPAADGECGGGQSARPRTPWIGCNVC